MKGLFQLFLNFVNSKIRWLSVYLVLYSLFINAQKSRIESINIAYKNAKHDTSLITALTNLGYYYYKSSPDTGISFLLKAKDICENNFKSENNPSMKWLYFQKYGLATNLLGWAYGMKQEHNSQIQYFLKSIKAYSTSKDKKGIAWSYYGISTVYSEIGELNKALISAEKSFNISREIGDEKQMSESLNSLGILYESIGKIKEAINAYEQALKLSEKQNNKNITARVLLNLGVVYAYQGQNEEALEYSNRSLKILIELGDKSAIAFCVNNIASTYYNLKQYDKALLYYYRSLKLSEEANDNEGTLMSLINICSSHLDNGNLDLAKSYIEKCHKIAVETGSKDAMNAYYQIYTRVLLNENKLKESLKYGLLNLELSQEIGKLEDTRIAANNLKMIYQNLNNYAKAYEMYSLSISIKDSIYNEENRDASFINKLKNEYEKAAIADSIKRANEKKIANSRLSESVAKLNRQKTQRIALIGGLALMLGFSGVFYNRFKKSQKQKQLIEKQKKIVDESQKKIIDSINYAKKIQNSILPSSDEITKLFPEHFIYFKPKDIVSGDFYWFHHENNLSIFAVADCTGHGVPGAFMTMIAHSSLIEVVIEQKITSPDKILSALHQQIFKNLQQQKGDENSQDGMDISLAVIDHRNNLLHFSGARNHGFLVDGAEIRTLKATPKSIGGLSMLGEIEPERYFKSESFQIHPDSLLILTTDGILDQLNKNDEKFGNERFKELINKLNTSGEKLNTIDHFFSSWKGETAQIDDILTVGIKL